MSTLLRPSDFTKELFLDYVCNTPFAKLSVLDFFQKFELSSQDEKFFCARWCHFMTKIKNIDQKSKLDDNWKASKNSMTRFWSKIGAEEKREARLDHYIDGLQDTVEKEKQEVNKVQSLEVMCRIKRKELSLFDSLPSQTSPSLRYGKRVKLPSIPSVMPSFPSHSAKKSMKNNDTSHSAEQEDIDSALDTSEKSAPRDMISLSWSAAESSQPRPKAPVEADISEEHSEFPDPTTNLMHFKTLNQDIEWTCNGTDMIEKYREFRAKNLGPYSLARDGIADLTPDSDFMKFLTPNVASDARKSRLEPIDITKIWPTFATISERVFKSTKYDDIAAAIKKEDMSDPVASYMFSIIMSYSHYFTFYKEIPQNLNEREGFTDLTWSFLRGALTMSEIETRHLEVSIRGVEERKNIDKDLLTTTKESGQFADGVAFLGDNQIYLAEASLLHQPKAGKKGQDEFKLVRAMRDSWISQVKATCYESIPRRGIAVFGSSSYKDQTKLWRMEFRGTFQLSEFDTFMIPLKKQEFGRKMKFAMKSCLELAARINGEFAQRDEEMSYVPYDERAKLADAVRLIQPTTPTPSKVRKSKSQMPTRK
ncbi:hypothetical protein BGX27_011053 [Mortierella sp. AM989]|nr:hypothetical protein BGX27_011053 [Mortierella sp. AM989]